MIEPTMEQLYEKAMVAKGELEKHGIIFDVHLTSQGVENTDNTKPALLQVTMNTPFVIELAAMLAAFLAMRGGVKNGEGGFPEAWRMN